MLVFLTILVSFCRLFRVTPLHLFKPLARDRWSSVRLHRLARFAADPAQWTQKPVHNSAPLPSPAPLATLLTIIETPQSRSVKFTHTGIALPFGGCL